MINLSQNKKGGTPPTSLKARIVILGVMKVTNPEMNVI
jgi:hypothetical protein